MSLLNEIEPLKQAALAELRAAPDLAALEQAKGAWLGAQGKFTALMKQLGSLPKEEKPAAGKLINLAKVELEAALAARREELELKAALPKEPTDFTLPGRRRAFGRLHPLTQVTEDIVRIFRKIGFAVADGPEIEDEYHCFDALNTPADHPARDAQDTFYVWAEAGQSRSAKPRMLLRTHTSSVQIRVMEKQPPPVRIIVPGRVYRRDNADATHNPTFQQIEGLYVDKGVTVGDLKGTVEFVFKELLGDGGEAAVPAALFFRTRSRALRLISPARWCGRWARNGWNWRVAAWCIRRCSRTWVTTRKSGRAGRSASASSASPCCVTRSTTSGCFTRMT